MLFDELPITFPWYKKLEQQNRYRENAEPYCDYQLISPVNALLPFQFIKTKNSETVNSWQILEANSGALIAAITNLGVLRFKNIEGKRYVTYPGGALTTAGGVMALPVGFYYSRIQFTGGETFYSEMFFVPAAGFSNSSDLNTDFLRLEWWNNTDVRPLFYNDLNAGKPYFRNVIYLDTFITASEPEIIQEGEKNGDDETVITFQKAFIRYRVHTIVADFVKKALHLMPLHSNIELTTPHAIRSGQIINVSVSSAMEAGGSLSIVDILFEQTVAMIKKNCADNMVFDV